MLVIINRFDPVVTAVFGCHKAEHCYKWLREHGKRKSGIWDSHIWDIEYNGEKVEAVVWRERYYKTMKFPFHIANE